MREEGMSDWAHQADETVLVARAGFERVASDLSLFFGGVFCRFIGKRHGHHE